MEDKNNSVIVNITEINDPRYLEIQKNKDNLKKILIIEALLCMLISYVDFNTNGGMSIINFPLDHLALLLRKMSLSSSFGNISAIIIYTLFCSIPLIIWAILKRKKRAEKIDNLLIVISILLFASIYLMINPNVMQTNKLLPFAFRNIILTSLNLTAVISYLILKFLHSLVDNSRETLLKSLKYLLIFVCLFIVYGLFSVVFKALLSSFYQVNQSSNSVPLMRAFNYDSTSINTWLAYIVLFFFKSIPYIIDLRIAFSMMDLIDCRIIDNYSKKSLEANDKLSERSKNGLKAICTAMVSFLLIAFFTMPNLQFINFNFDIPIFAIVFAIASLILSNLLKENQELKDENDMFE